MSNEPKNQHVFLNDGDTLIVVAQTQGSTESDPFDVYPFTSQAYRVVADRFGPTLALVPLSEKPIRVSQDEISRYAERQDRVNEQKTREALAEAFRTIIEASGWKSNTPIIMDAKLFDPTGTILGNSR